jgi:hypothetical protein
MMKKRGARYKLKRKITPAAMRNISSWVKIFFTIRREISTRFTD